MDCHNDDGHVYCLPPADEGFSQVGEVGRMFCEMMKVDRGYWLLLNFLPVDWAIVNNLGESSVLPDGSWFTGSQVTSHKPVGEPD